MESEDWAVPVQVWRNNSILGLLGAIITNSFAKDKAVFDKPRSHFIILIYNYKFPVKYTYSLIIYFQRKIKCGDHLQFAKPL